MICNLIATTTSSISVPIPILHPKNLFFLPSPSFLSSSSSHQQIPRRLLNRFPVRHLSCSSFSPTQPPWNCSSNVPVMVWWDFDSCRVPSGVSWLKVAPSIMAAVRANGIKGQIQIGAFGDYESSKIDEDSLMSTGITCHTVHYSFGGNNNAYNALLKELMFWVSRNPPPAHLFLILGDRDDRDLSGILHRLRMKNYNILIACSGSASDTLCSATTVMWEWTSMLKGEDVMGKQFNHPPNWPSNLFYGDSKMPLEKSFSATQKSSQNASEVPYSSPVDKSLVEKKKT